MSHLSRPSHRGSREVSPGDARRLTDAPVPGAGERYYWIEKASLVDDDTISITAEEIVKDDAAEWGFRYTGWNRVALAQVDAYDVTFDRWTDRFEAPQAAQLADLVQLAPDRIEYSHRKHPELELDGGKILMSAAKNWTDGRKHPIDTYRPVFSAVDP